MKELDDIKKQLQDFSSKYGPETIVTARVTQVNENDTIAIQFSDESTVDDCRLKAIVKDGNKVILFPKVGSVVLVGRIENGEEFVVISVDEVSEILYKIGDVSYNVDNNGFLLKKGTDTLLKALKLLIESIQPIVVLQGNNPNFAKLTQALAMINNLLR